DAIVDPAEGQRADEAVADVRDDHADLVHVSAEHDTAARLWTIAALDRDQAAQPVLLEGVDQRRPRSPDRLARRSFVAGRRGRLAKLLKVLLEVQWHRSFFQRGGCDASQRLERFRGRRSEEHRSDSSHVKISYA